MNPTTALLLLLLPACGPERSVLSPPSPAAPPARPAASPPPAYDGEGAALIGTTLPEFPRMQWLQMPPPTLASLRGKVVLIRFWLDVCPYCEHSAPALNEFYDRYREKGLEVIGLHTPKPKGPRPPERIAAAAQRLGFRFPIAIDADWAALDKYWMSTGRHTFTSMSFLLDRKGVVRHLHPGGEFHARPEPGRGVAGGENIPSATADSAAARALYKPEHEACVRDYERMRAWIEYLLQE